MTNTDFITTNRESDTAPLFRRKFMLLPDRPFKKAVLTVCGLGYGYYWLNSQRVTTDLFTAPVSDYTKTLWYNRYDVTKYLKPGENIAAVILGNGWYNESYSTPWDYDKAPWRDKPKFALELELDGEVLLKSDSEWKYSFDRSPIIFNHLRSGEHFDARLYDPAWNTLDYDDSDWQFAFSDPNPPAGILRECTCEPIRECAEFSPKSIVKLPSGDYLYDFNQNMSGYVRVTANQKSGDKLTIRYGEQADDNGLVMNGMREYFPHSVFATDEFICSGKPATHSPLFAYHGFRYVTVTGLEKPENAKLTAVFVHQNVKFASKFSCSDPSLNALFKLGQNATLSNLFYMPTDCPTREKLGWTNDAASSTEQFLLDFSTEKLLKKWLRDILDAQRPDGSLPGIIPTGGWGYEWGSGPLSGSVLFEIPTRLYQIRGDKQPLVDCLSAFTKYLAFNERKFNADGLIAYGLCDWAGPYETLEASPTPIELTDSAMLVGFYDIAVLAAQLAGQESDFAEKAAALRERIKAKYIKDGLCTVDEQTAVSMLIYYDIYDDLAPLAGQLARAVERHNLHHHCGMVGLRRLYPALDKCGLSEYGLKILLSEGYPSYTDWLKRGATTLCETWQEGNSQNHHMYSSFMAWLIKSVAGIKPAEPGFSKVRIRPLAFGDLTRCDCELDTVKGKITVHWKRKNGKLELSCTVPHGVEVIA
ncbi:MAG TPA: family 78 glycoside hydrolase catalytic domain [Oscillospiraceae bacterium]|nr:family 78 glycoside hydrolase catalytic domain [Oscillospiraceae bacterium]HPS34083.1 family 78 glycoside hydrolase catalytic domain [Oscillospiraceae bacterium]